jgi:hypothetical protein
LRGQIAPFDLRRFPENGYAGLENGCCWAKVCCDSWFFRVVVTASAGFLQDHDAGWLLNADLTWDFPAIRLLRGTEKERSDCFSF